MLSLSLSLSDCIFYGNYRHIALCEIHKTLFEVCLGIPLVPLNLHLGFFSLPSSAGTSLISPPFKLFRNFYIDLVDPLHPCTTDNLLTFVVHDMRVSLTARQVNLETS